MRFIALILLTLLVGCATPKLYPPEDCVIIVGNPDATIPVFIPKGYFNDPNNYFTKDDLDGIKKEDKERGI